MITECTHTERWRLVITRDSNSQARAEDWPDKLLVNGLRTRHIRPDQIIVDLRGGLTDEEQPLVRIWGDKIVPASEHPVKVRSESRYQLVKLPDWAADLVTRARLRHGCGPGRVNPW